MPGGKIILFCFYNFIINVEIKHVERSKYTDFSSAHDF